MKGTGCLYICNVSDDVIPEETVRLAIDVLEHLDECLEQAYDKLGLWYFVDHKRSPGKDCFTHDPKKVFELDDIIFGLEDWPHCDYIEKYCLYPETKTEADCRVRVAQENQNIRKRMAKLAKHLGWKVTPSPTWCRHSFATNLAHQGVPMQYISDAMGHRVGKSVTMSYINMYPHEKQMEYNSLLLNLPSSKKQKSDLESIIKSLSEKDKMKLLKMILNES